MGSYLLLTVYDQGVEVLAEMFNLNDIKYLRLAKLEYERQGYECRTENHETRDAA